MYTRRLKLNSFLNFQDGNNQTEIDRHWQNIRFYFLLQAWKCPFFAHFSVIKLLQWRSVPECFVSRCFFFCDSFVLNWNVPMNEMFLTNFWMTCPDRSVRSRDKSCVALLTWLRHYARPLAVMLYVRFRMRRALTAHFSIFSPCFIKCRQWKGRPHCPRNIRQRDEESQEKRTGTVHTGTYRHVTSVLCIGLSSNLLEEYDTVFHLRHNSV